MFADGKVPSVFSWIGMGSGRKGTTSGLHTPKMKIDDDALPLGGLASACPPASCNAFRHNGSDVHTMTLQVLPCTQPLPLNTSTSKLGQAVSKVNCDLKS